MEFLKKYNRYVSLNILGMLGLSFYILADTYFVSKALGIIGIAALNLSISVYSIIHGLGLMIGIGAASRFTILKSQGRYKNANMVFANAFKLSLIIGFILGFMGIFFSAKIASFLGADNYTFANTRIYLKIILLFAPFYITNNLMLAFIRNDKNPNLSMLAMLIGSISNVILDYVFIFNFDMGMLGAALATGLAPIISLMVLAFHFKKGKYSIKFEKTRLRLKIVIAILAMGMSSFIVETSSAIALITLNIIIFKLEGNVGLGAYGIIANISLVVIAIFTGLAQGSQPLLSKYYGEANFKMLIKTRKYSLVSALIIGTIVYTLTLINLETIIQVFNSENNMYLKEIASDGLRIYFLGFFFAGINIVTSMFFSLTENISYALSISLLRGFALIVPMTIFLSHYFSIKGVWFAFVLSELMVSLMCLFFIVNREGIVIKGKVDSSFKI